MAAEVYEGRPCEHGHTIRYRSNRKCVACHTLPAVYIVLEVRAMPALAPVLATQGDAERYITEHGGEIWRATPIE